VRVTDPCTTVATGTRVGNHIGVGDATAAQRSARIGLVLAVCVSCAVCALLFCMRRQWGALFVGDETDPVARLVAESVPLVAAYILGDTLGPGWAHQVLWSLGGGLVRPTAIIIVAFWVVGIPLGCTLAFHHGQRLFGLWTGLATGMWLHGGGLVLFCLCGGVDWAKLAEVAKRRSTASDAQQHTTRSLTGSNDAADAGGGRGVAMLPVHAPDALLEAAVHSARCDDAVATVRQTVA
jgi:multidrug resistance protein, MATE family